MQLLTNYYTITHFSSKKNRSIPFINSKLQAKKLVIACQKEKKQTILFNYFYRIYLTCTIMLITVQTAKRRDLSHKITLQSVGFDDNAVLIACLHSALYT